MKSNWRSIFTVLQVSLLLNTAGAKPRLDVSSTQVISGLSEVFEVNCSFTLDQLPNMAAFMSLMVSRVSNLNDSDTQIATVSDLTDQGVHKLTDESVTVEGFFNALGESYLNLHWDKPSEEQAGIYKCSAQGFDDVGRFVAIMSTAEVTAHELSYDEWTVKVKEMDGYAKSLEKMIVQMNANAEVLENRIQEMNVQMNAFNESVQEMRLDIERKSSGLELYANRLEERISSLASERLANISLMFEAPRSYKNHKYYVSKDGFLRIEIAHAICSVYGGYLAELNDAEEYFAIRNFLEAFNVGMYGVVIGGSDEGHEGTWVFPSTNQTMPYMNWYIGNPNGGKMENCLCLWAYNTWQMMDWSCHRETASSSYRFLCEIPQTGGV